MTTRLPVLDNARIAKPCPADWDEMAGDDRRRFCEQCSLHVYNIAGLSTREAERLILQSEGRVCGRLYRRPDGTIITRDCPVGLRLARKKLAWVVGKVAAAVIVFGGFIGLVHGAAPSRGPTPRPMETILKWIDPDRGAPVMMGEISIPSPPPAGRP